MNDEELFLKASEELKKGDKNEALWVKAMALK